MDEVVFHREPPTNVPTLVVACGGWVDARETATDAMRSLARQLDAVPLASSDSEDFCSGRHLWHTRPPRGRLWGAGSSGECPCRIGRTANT